MKSLSIKNISYFELGLAATVIISFFLFCLWVLWVLHIDSPEKFATILTVLAAIYAPFGAHKIAEKWKEQKTFDFKKEYEYDVLDAEKEMLITVSHTKIYQELITLINKLNDSITSHIKII